MKTHWRTGGIILKKTDRGEANRVFTAFTKDFGKLHLWAIGERKIASKLRGGLEILCLSELEFVQGKNKKTITDAILLKRFDFARADLVRLRVAFRILETLDVFLKGQMQDAKIWNLLLECLDLLNSKTFPVRRCSFVYYYFFWNLVAHLGWRPRLAVRSSGASAMVGALLEGNLAVLSEPAIEKFSTLHLHRISRRYFIEIQKELQ